MNPVVVALHVAPAKRDPVVPVERVRMLEGRGAEGDHHALAGSRRQVLLMSAETLAGFGLEPGAVREQVTVKGLDVMGLAEGTKLAIGSAEFEVGMPCAPCELMERIRPGLRSALEGRRGRFVQVVRAGSVTVGDALEIRPE